MNNILRTIRFYLREIDLPLTITLLVLLLIGVVNIYGIADSESIFFKKQVIFVMVGFAAMIFLSFFNYRYLKNYSLPVLMFYSFSIFLLGLTFYSQSIRGTNSWIILGNVTFEPAELTKLCLIVLMAKYFSQKHIHINQFRHIIASGVYFILPAALIINQPDLGSTIILALIWASLLLAAGINKKNILILVSIALIIALIGWFFFLKPYQKARVLSFMDQDSDPRGVGYNLIQSKVAIGSGSWLGSGLGKGSQANLGFLPEPHNDFIFAAFVEQFGFIGAIVLIGIVVFLVYRILMIGLTTVSNFGKLFSIGMAVFIFSHIFISAGVNIGILPVTGLPFPFLSAGGSNLISIMTGLGILQSIKRYG